MRYYIINFFVFISLFSASKYSLSEITVEELFFDNTKPFNLKILEAIPENGKIEIGPKNAKNTIIEFMDYFCSYCKKIHPELIELVEKRNDTRVIFLQHPILSQSSTLIAEMVVAASYQNKDLEFHNKLFTIQGNITREKLDKLIESLEINSIKFSIDLSKDETKNIVKLSSFLANGVGARGTPTLFINEEIVPGYISAQQIKSLLK